MQQEIDINGIKRIRWIVIPPNIVEEPLFIKKYSSYITSGSTDASSKEDDNFPPPLPKKSVIVLRRMLKPEYAAKNNSLSIHSTSVDNMTFVDLADKTLWIQIEQLMSIDDFYKNVVSNDLNHDKYIGYEIDQEPSFNLVPLMQLKRTLVEWWCS